MRLLASLCAGLAVALVLSQSSAAKSRSRGRPDSGPESGEGRESGKIIYLGTDPPGRLKPSAAVIDAGVRSLPDAGPDEVHRELQGLRNRVDALERERAAARGEALRVDQLAAEVRALRAHASQGDARRQAEEDDRVARQEEVSAALGGLAGAQQRLAEGDAAVDEQLAQAEGQLAGEAQRDVQYAREALRNRDLSLARAWLSAAARAAQPAR